MALEFKPVSLNNGKLKWGIFRTEVTYSVNTSSKIERLFLTGNPLETFPYLYIKLPPQSLVQFLSISAKMASVSMSNQNNNFYVRKGDFANEKVNFQSQREIKNSLDQ